MCFERPSLLLKGCAMSGLIADAKTLIDKARVETQVSVELAEFKYTCIFKLNITILSR